MRFDNAEGAVFVVGTRLHNAECTLTSASLEKIRFNYRSAEVGASLPWHAFFVPSSPYRARKDPGASSRALFELVGPMNFLHLLIAF